ncbi:MAG: hypothetical protein KF744_17045 [Taibaiella sp.]|nr:hypothetical protein [Taibaiella sp.]
MKSTILTILATAGMFLANAQQAIPEFKNKVMVLTKNNTLENLETTTLTYGVKSGFGKGSVFLKADGQHASTTYDPTSGNKFIVKIVKDTDPETLVTLYNFTVEKKYRKIVTAGVGFGNAKDIELPTPKLNFTKVQDGVYIITPVKPLEPGEYIFMVDQPLTGPGASEAKGQAFAVPESK